MVGSVGAQKSTDEASKGDKKTDGVGSDGKNKSKKNKKNKKSKKTDAATKSESKVYFCMLTLSTSGQL